MQILKSIHNIDQICGIFQGNFLDAIASLMFGHDCQSLTHSLSQSLMVNLQLLKISLTRISGRSRSLNSRPCGQLFVYTLGQKTFFEKMLSEIIAAILPR